jgi:hypothetical protein
VLATAVGQLATPPLVGFDPPDGPDPAITPPAAAFAVWTPIVGASLVYAIDQARPSRRDIPVLDEIAVPVALAFAGFSVWLVAAQGDAVWLTVAVFFGMLAALLRALARLRAAGDALPAETRALARAALGLYAGWSTVAVWVNLASALIAAGADPRATGWQAGILGAAAASAGAGAVWLRGSGPYVGAAVYGLSGAAAGAAGRGAPCLARLAGGAALGRRHGPARAGVARAPQAPVGA